MLQHLIDAQNKLVEALKHLNAALEEHRDDYVVRIRNDVRAAIGTEEGPTFGIVSLETIIRQMEDAMRD
jgi:hypothetical protein